ncbi:MAG TPA: HD domain-containing phosphohydrolase [Verrucomicrobiae bacterium]|jgi:response regulator RpfG family c-di-GMP phosphodiesterase|nr:HD domain-containing phosphohydrolase [Verrucomicrobiae bacterium]
MPAEETGLRESGHPILIVDDEEIVLVALRDTLLREGYNVVASPHAVHALSVLKERTFSVVITDQQMPLVTGLEFLAQVKQIQPNATRILITAVLSLSTVIDAINKGEIYRFIVKPWLREELLATVKNAVQRFELISHNARLHAEALAVNEKLKLLNQELETQMATVAEQNHQLAKHAAAQEENLRQSVQLCVQMMQTFYPTLGNQARRVFELCKAMANELELPSDQWQTLEIAAWIHDLGLVGVPRSLIKRWEETPETLTEDERALVQHHPVLGAELAHFAHHLEQVSPTIAAHHECFDGSGYPNHLKGEDIPWLARVLTVAVAYAESNLVGQAAADHISSESGSAFDPEAVRVFLRSLPKSVVPGKQREVRLVDLKPGMVLAQGIYTANGVLLIPDGQKLTPTYIDKVINYNRINPISQSLLVYC